MTDCPQAIPPASGEPRPPAGDSARAAALATARVDAALAARPDAPVVVDLDGTLLLRNSTECFLDAARPRLLAALILKAIDVAKPWRLLPAGGGSRSFAWRDPLRVWAITLLMPWTWWLWRRRGAPAARRALNAALQARVGPRGAVIATYGFQAVVRPLLGDLYPARRIVAAPLLGAVGHRRRGKATALDRRMGGEALDSAILITDHAENDADIIARAADSVVVEWPGHREIPAQSGVYLPFDYTEKVKHPGERHVANVFFGEDGVALAIATLFAAGSLGGAAIVLAAVGLLIASFFLVYEIGYAENDHLGLKTEARPMVHDGHDRWPLATIARTNALAAAIAGAAGVALLAFGPARTLADTLGIADPGLAFAALAGFWTALLVAQRLAFAAFNRTRPKGRIAVFPLLQLLKGFGIVAALGLAITPAGAALLAAVAGVRAVPYAIYRLGGSRWRTPDQVLRLASYIVLVAILAVSLPAGGVLEAGAAAGLLWCALKARRETLRVVLGQRGGAGA
ncbi:MAG: hypothetical protein RID91_22260 [Azospirillaceae bacterium]